MPDGALPRPGGGASDIYILVQILPPSSYIKFLLFFPFLSEPYPLFGLGPSTVSPKTGWPPKVTLWPSSLIGFGTMKLACFQEPFDRLFGQFQVAISSRYLEPGTRPQKWGRRWLFFDVSEVPYGAIHTGQLYSWNSIHPRMALPSCLLKALSLKRCD